MSPTPRACTPKSGTFYCGYGENNPPRALCASRGVLRRQGGKEIHNLVPHLVDSGASRALAARDSTLMRGCEAARLRAAESSKRMCGGYLVSFHAAVGTFTAQPPLLRPAPISFFFSSPACPGKSGGASSPPPAKCPLRLHPFLLLALVFTLATCYVSPAGHLLPGASDRASGGAPCPP